MLGFKSKPEDPLFNRRRCAVVMSVYTILWGFIILVCSIIFDMGVGKVAAFLGYISTLSGAGLFAYFTAAKAEPPRQIEEGEDAED